MTDEELMQAYAGGDVEAFRLLYQRHRARVFGFLVARLKERTEAEEVFQEVFARLHANRLKYREEMPFLAWLFTLVKNALVDHLRKQQTRGKYLELSPDAVRDAADEQADIEEVGGDAGEVIAQLSSLSREQRRLLSLRFNEGLSFAEIAESLDISPSNARKFASRAIRKLRSLMAGEER